MVKVKEVKSLVSESKKYFQNSLAEFVYYRTYSRWIPEQGRRETWIETVQRYMDYMKENLGKKLTKQEYKEISSYILNQQAMPSMRLLWSAGRACRKTNVCAYNCSFVAPSKLEDFAEIMYLLMCGTGVGFSVEKKNVDQLPIIEKQGYGTKALPYIIDDSKEGWGDAITHGLTTWYDGKDTDFDFSKLRPAGARLENMGGQSSGPEPLKNLLMFARKKIFERQGQKLRPIDVHDIVCMIGEIVVSGGVRRSAQISLSDLTDKEMRTAKFGKFWEDNPQRAMANNSTVYEVKPSSKEFLEEWTSLALSGSGERGIFNRGNIMNNFPSRRRKGFKKYLNKCGTNPCSEIILRNYSFCNLSEVICREDDTEKTLMEKIRIATILGTYQSTLTYFPYLSKEWKKNCDEERLLGVSLTGQWDCLILRKDKKTANESLLKKLRNYAVKVNKEYAKRFKITQSVCVTCTKPSGTLSQMVNASSGMHPRHSQYYIRRVRIANTDPLFHMIKEMGYPYYPEVSQDRETATTYVLEFPVKSQASSIMKDDLSAIDLLKWWKSLKKNYTEHNPSVTISVGDDEWVKTANWVYKNWDIIGGVSFLPRDNHIYELAPYEEITEEQYKKMVTELPDIDFSNIIGYEKQDATIGSHELACSAGGTCEMI